MECKQVSIRLQKAKDNSRQHCILHFHRLTVAFATVLSRLFIIALLFMLYGCIITPLGGWSSLGPEEIIESYYAGPNSGRVTVMAVNPSNQNDVWLGTATGGVWHSSNINATDYLWESVSDSAPQSIGALLVEDCSAVRCNTIWVGTGENNIRRDTYYGAGLLILSWGASDNKYIVETVGDSEERFKYGSIIDIKRLGDVLYIAVSKGKSASASTTIVTAPEPADGYGIHRSSDDGLTWEKVGTSPANALPSDMEVQNNSLVVGFFGQGVYRLSSGDTWCPFGPAASIPASCPAVSSVLPDPSSAVFDHVEVAVAPGNPSVIYAAYGQCSGSETLWCKEAPTYHASPAFFVSQDGGMTWQSRTNTELIKTYSRYTHVLEVNPQFDSRIYYGGLDLWASFNYGDNFGKVLDSGYLHLDQQALVFPVPTVPLKQYVGTDGGFYIRDRATMPGDTYPRNFGLKTIQFYSVCSSDWDGAQLLMGGTQDNGTVLFNGTTQWEFVVGGDGGDCSIARENLYYASVYNIAPKVATTASPNEGDFDDFEQGIDQSDSHLFFPPFVMHPFNHDLYFGTHRLYKRREADSQWTIISPVFDASTNVWPEIERRNAISAVALSRSNQNVIYLALYNGDIWRSADTGPCETASCWTQVGGAALGNGLPDSVPTSLEVDPENANTVYVTYSDFSENPKVWRSEDGGSTWQAFATGLPKHLPIKVIKVDPVRRYLLYAGTDNGIYRRNLRGDIYFTQVIPGIRWLTDWRLYKPDSGMPGVPVYDIAIDSANDLVYAATHGRGMFVHSPEPLIYYRIYFANEQPQGLYLFGHAFERANKATCSVTYIDKRGNRIATTSSDARGGKLRLNGSGRLASVNDKKFGSTQMVAPCLKAECLDQSQAVHSFSIKDIHEVELTCGEQTVKKWISPRPALVQNPSSTLLVVRKLDKKAKGRVHLKAIPIAGAMTTQKLVEALRGVVLITEKDTNQTISQKLVESFNAAAKKRSVNYVANLVSKKKKEKQSREGEVEHRGTPFISLKNRTLKANQIFTAFRAEPGEANQLAFYLESIGLLAKSELVQVKINFITGSNGAKGGSVALVQRTPAGACKVSVNTAAGQTARQIAGELYRALMDMEYPGTRDCASRQNPYDIALKHNSLITSSAIGVSVEIRDAGVGLSVSPYEPNSD
jgi:hypothetical protein